MCHIWMYFANFDAQSYLERVFSFKQTNSVHTFFTKCYFVKTRYPPCCCLGQLGLKSAGFGRVPEIWSESLCVSGRGF